MQIKKLSEYLIKQIAAGEVIGRPANAIKELIENSLDAHTSYISIYLTNTFDNITIIDNGHGIHLEDLKIATNMHTTSKTPENTSVFGANNFGFRGEALASIDAIANLTIHSNGYKICKNEISKSNVLNGTKIEIQNIFQHIPARLKFLKNANIEIGHIKEMIKKYIIGFEKIKWEVYNNEKKLWSFLPCTKKARIDSIMKEESVFFEHTHTQHDLKISGYLLRNKMNYSLIFVNQRPVKDKAIIQYLKSIFKEYSFIHENFGYVLFIEIDPFFIDCNVHPSKEEVRFLNYQEIFSCLSFVLSYDFFNSVYKIDHPVFSSTASVTMPIPQTPSFNFSKPQAEFLQENDHVLTHAPTPIQLNLQKPENTDQQVRIISQIHNSFIIFETHEGIGIFDQHAAHERKLYENMKLNLNKNNAQMLIEPIAIEMNELIQNNLDTLANLGIFISNNNKITHMPSFIDHSQIINILSKQNVSFETEIMRLLADVACKRALKANTSLSFAQMQSLLADALNCIPICNHGRPVFKYFTIGQIESWFHR